MKVEQILAAKGTSVHAVREDDTITEAVDILNGKNIGAVVVKNGSGQLVGILSERDVVRRIGQHGADALSLPVSTCMTAEPVTSDRETTVDELMAKMTERRIRHMPIVENNELVGLVSIGDVVKRKINEAEQEAAALKDYIAS